MKRGKKILIILLSVLVCLFLIRLYIDHNLLKITSYEVSSNKIPNEFDGYRILQLSDLHSKDFDYQLLDKVSDENPDIVVLTGDMVSADQHDYSVFLGLAKKLATKYQVYYIKGNHEGELSQENYKIVKDALEIYGVRILNNEKVTLEKDGSSINLYGMWCNQRYYSRADADKEYVIKEETVTKLLGEAANDEYNVLLMHTPTYFEAYEAWGADLVLSGHMHGGLVRLPFVGGVFSPDRKLFPEYCYGRFDLNDTTMVISSGLSRGNTGFRLFNRPEIVSITLRSKE